MLLFNNTIFNRCYKIEKWGIRNLEKWGIRNLEKWGIRNCFNLSLV